MQHRDIYTAAEKKFSERDFALYELIIVKNKGRNTVKATTAVDKKNLSEDRSVGQTWAERGLPEPALS